jgi:hypothetical protein
VNSTTTQTIRYQITNPELPLAVYREIAAHLRQVEGVDTGLILRPLEGNREEFDYAQSQIAALSIEHPQDLAKINLQTIESILDYYAQKYRPWEKI